jgi:tetratricopeptide (TPR) repeat protein
MPNRKKVKTLLPSCNNTLLASLVVGLLLLNGCSSTASRHATPSEAAKVQPLPRDYENALTLMRSGDYGAAIPVLQDFSGRHPDLAGPCVNLGIAYRQIGDKAAALAALDKAIELNPDNAPAYLQRGIMLREAGDFQGALHAYDQALTLQPDYALAHRNIGILYDLYLQQPGQALTHYKRYLELIDDDDKTVSGWVIDLERRANSAQASMTQ